MTVLQEISKRLQKLNPIHLTITDDSHKHANHPSSKDGGHFSILIVSNHFMQMNRIERQRQINHLLAGLFQQKIHALSIQAFTQEEYSS